MGNTCEECGSNSSYCNGDCTWNTSESKCENPNACGNCPANTYNDKSASITPCGACPAGLVTNGTGASVCICPPGDTACIRNSEITQLKSAMTWSDNSTLGVMFHVSTSETFQAEAQQYCENLGQGVHLAVPKNAEEHQMIAAILQEQSWLGIKRSSADSSKWLAGSTEIS